MPLPSASIVFGWPICDNRQKKWKIRTIVAINNCSMRQQALIDTREIWRSRKLCKSSSRWIQMQLLVLEAFLNFPKCFITWPTHTWIMTQLFFCKKRHQRAKLGVAAPSRYWKIYYLCYELNQNTKSTLKHDSIEKMCKRKTKIFTFRFHWKEHQGQNAYDVQDDEVHCDALLETFHSNKHAQGNNIMPRVYADFL